MIRQLLFGILIATLCSSCVSSKIYEDLKIKHDALKAENEALMAQLDANTTGGERYTVANLRKEIDKLKAENTRLAMDMEAANKNHVSNQQSTTSFQLWDGKKG